MFEKISPLEIVVVGMVLLLLFGGKKLPELTRGLVDSIKEFRSAYKEGSEDDKK